MAYAFEVGAALGALSGLVLSLLGLLVLRIRPHRPASLAFSAFAILWGAQVVAANASELAVDLRVGLFWVHTNTALLIPLYVPLFAFALTYPVPVRWRVSLPTAIILLAVPAMALLTLFAAESSLFISGGGELQEGVFFARPGPLLRPIIFWNSLLSFAFVSLLTANRLFRARKQRTRSQLALITAALLTYVSYQVAAQSGLALLWASTYLSVDGAALYVLRLLVLILALLIWGHVTSHIVKARDLPWRDLLLTTAFLPLLVGGLEAALVTGGILAFSTVGIWRLGMVGLFAYAIARYRMFDIDLRLKALAPVAAYAAAALACVGLLWAWRGELLQSAPWLGLATTAGVAALFVPGIRTGRNLLARLVPHLEEPDHLYKRKLDVYRAALEEARDRGLSGPEEERFLADLRRRLGVTTEEHRVLLATTTDDAARSSAGGVASPDRFRIERVLGRGSFGRAVLAHDTLLDRRVVLKQPLAEWVRDPDAREAFLREARVAARVHHPNVVAVHDVVAEPEPCLVLEYVSGGNLERVLADGGPLPAAEGARVVLDVLNGLGVIHAAGIVHRDLKPENVLLTPEGQAKVTDFGVARIAGGGRGTTPGVQPGSLAFMSPEQARGERVDARTDLYAAGVLLYRVLTGKHYMDLTGRTAAEVRQLIQDTPPRLPAPGVPPGAEVVVRKALAKDASARYASAEEMARALQEALPVLDSAASAREH